MGKAHRIMLSVMLITSLGCGRMPSQTGVRAQTALLPQVEGGSAGSTESASALAFDPLDLSVEEHDHDLVPETMRDYVDHMAMELNEDVKDPDHGSLSPLDPAPRMLRLYDLNERTMLELAINEDGSVAEADRPQLEYFFRCRRSQQTHEMAKGVLKIMYAIDRAFPGHVIEIVSGFRTFPFGVRDSKHYEGHAIDLRLRGVRTTRVRDFVWKHFADVGVGYYGHHNFVHVDYRPEAKDTAWTSPQPNAAYAYNPSWALRIRAPWRAPRAINLEGATASR